MSSPTVDLTTMHDHPAVLLDAEARRSLHDVERMAIRRAAQTLRDHEAAHGVTFSTFDNGALAAVRDAYGRTKTETRGWHKHTVALNDLQDAVRDLLGLGD